MAYKKQDWKPFDESLSIEENALRGGIVTAEQMNYIESGIEGADQLADKHIKDKSNPHSVTANQVGLGNVKNFDIATTSEATAGAANNKYMTPFLVSEALKSTKETLNKTQMSKVTANNGQAFMTITNATLLDSFVNQGPGFYTFVTGGTTDAPPEVPIRGYVNMTREGIANVFAVSDSGKFYFRFLENNKWKNDWQKLSVSNDQETPLANLLDNTKFKEYSTSVNDKLTVRRSGNVVQICGTLTPTTTIAAGETTIFKVGSLLPSWARPRDQLVCTMHHGTNVANFLSRVSKEGDILIGRYSEPTTNSPIAMTAGVWLPINIVYIV